MAAFRILNQAPQYLLASGEVNAGGSLTFYETDLTTLKDTWSDPDLNTLNSNPVLLDSAGRSVTDIWGDGEYGVVCKDAEGTTLWTRNNVRVAAGASQEIPALVSGQFLTNDGSNLSWAAVREVPDPTGLIDYYLISDGEQAVWQPIPEPDPPSEVDIEVTSSTVVLTDNEGNEWQIVRGTATTASGVGTLQAQGSVTYDTSFAESVAPMVTLTGGPFAPGNEYGGYYGDLSVTSYNANGFTFIVNTNHADPGPGAQEEISGNITVGFLAMGPL